jgi:hypothetical protein
MKPTHYHQTLMLALALGLASLSAAPASAQQRVATRTICTSEARIICCNAVITEHAYIVLITKETITAPEASAPQEDLMPSLVSFMGQAYELTADHIFSANEAGEESIVPFFGQATVEITDVQVQENGWYHIYVQATTGETGYFVVTALEDMYSFLSPQAPEYSLKSQMSFLNI